MGICSSTPALNKQKQQERDRAKIRELENRIKTLEAERNVVVQVVEKPKPSPMSYSLLSNFRDGARGI